MFKILLLFFVIAGILFAIYSVTTKQLVRAIFAMFACFFCVAAVLVFAQAEFLAVAHLMIYIGGIIVVMLFAIMLSSKNILSNDQSKEPTSKALKFTQLISGLAILLLFLGLTTLIIPTFITSNPIQANVEVKALGFEMLSKYTVIIELISLVLLVALIGAALINRKAHD
jgi:NADH:ubiquinone oxidoreductase subunit 6 (subunit J)